MEWRSRRMNRNVINLPGSPLGNPPPRPILLRGLAAIDFSTLWIWAGNLAADVSFLLGIPSFHWGLTILYCTLVYYQRSEYIGWFHRYDPLP